MENKKNLILNITLTFLYAVCTIIFVLHHEIWADEAQVWLIAKNLSVFDFSLFKHLVNEGHPSFFYLLVMPFAKLNFPVATMQFLCWLSSVVSVFLLLTYSPFNKLTKIAIIISGGFLYFFPVIARSYSILPLLVFLLAIVYPKSGKHSFWYAILLVLTANTHVIMYAFVFGLGILFVYENIERLKNFDKKILTSSLIIILGLAAVVLQLCTTMSSNGAITFDTNNCLLNFIRTVSVFFLNATDTVFVSAYSDYKITAANIVFASLEAVICLILLVRLFFYDKKISVICLFGIVFQFFIYIFSYKVMLYQTRIFSAYLIILFGYWAANASTQKIKLFDNIVILLFFVLTCWCGIKSAILDYTYNYSSAKETAEFIKNNIAQDSLIIPNLEACPLAVYLYLPQYKFYSAYTDKQIKYMIWYKQMIRPDNDFSEYVEKSIKKHAHSAAYVIVSSLLDANHLEKTLPEKYKLIFKSSPSIVSGETFRVYQYTGSTGINKSNI